MLPAMRQHPGSLAERYKGAIDMQTISAHRSPVKGNWRSSRRKRKREAVRLVVLTVLVTLALW